MIKMLEQSINVKLTTLNLPENVFIYCLYLSTAKTRAAGARDVRRTQGYDKEYESSFQSRRIMSVIALISLQMR